MEDLKVTPPPEEDFAALLESAGADSQFVPPMRGDLRKGVIVQVRPNEVVVDIGFKAEALVAARELQEMPAEEFAALQVGAPIHVYVLQPGYGERTTIVSIERARAHEDWLRAEEMLESGEIITLTVSGYNKGGLVCDFGRVQGFVPASQVANLPQRVVADERGDRLAQLMGEKLPLKVIEVDRRRRRLILSERMAVREWRAQQRDQLLAELQEGDIRTGTVSNLCDFGAFVDLGGMDGLVHISEIAWQRIGHPSERLKVGQEVQVQVLRVDRKAQRIGLSIKRIAPDPWEGVEARYYPGQVLRGTVTHVVRFGAFVALEPGVEGLIHVSEFDGAEEMPTEGALQEGQEVEVTVLDVNAERRQIALTINHPAEEAQEAGLL